MARVLAFSGFGDAPIVFLDYNGAVVTPPSTNPTCGSGCDGFVRLSTGAWGVVGGNAPTFPNTGAGIFAADFLTALEVNPVTALRGFAGGCDSLGNFYACGSSVLLGRGFNRFSSAAVQTGTFNVGAIGSNVVGGAPSQDGTVFYYVENTDLTTVKRWDITNDLALSNFVTRAGKRAGGGQRILTLTNGDVLIGWSSIAPATLGDVVRYNSAGTVQSTYTLPGTVDNDPTSICIGQDETTIWLGYYAGEPTSSAVRVVEIVLTTGVIAHSFVPEIGAFEFDGAFAEGELGPTAYVPSVGTERPLRKVRRSPTFSTEKMWNLFGRFEIDFQSGGPRDDHNEPIRLCLRYSNNSGHTWSDQIWLDADVRGQYDAVADWYRLGRGRDRVWEVSSTSAALTVWLGAYLDVTPGTH